MEFQFKPGDIVAMKCDQHWTGPLPPPHWTVLERITQECSGGVQRKYILRAFATSEPDRNGQSVSRAVAMEVQDFEVATYPSCEEIDRLADERNKRTVEHRKKTNEMKKAAGLSTYE